MRRTWIVLIAAALFSCRPYLSHGQGREPHRRALLVAVTGYEKNHAYAKMAPELDTLPDVLAIKKVLMAQFGFNEEDITVLQTPEETTHAGILKAFRATLIQPTQPGDIVCFHYSGHGSEVEDPNDPTGIDQTLVPSDYISHDDGKNDIRDKEIALLLKELQAKHPGSVLLTFDSCHSGDITRGRMRVRGFDRPLKNRPEQRGEDLSLQHTAEEAMNLGFVAISACRSDECDSQIELNTADRTEFAGPSREMGSLSYALYRALGEADKTTTYREIFERICSIMHEKGLTQNPQMEGIQDKVLFDNRILLPETTLFVDVEKGHGPRLQAGALMGMTVGSTLEIFARGANSLKHATPIATAVITSLHATAADLKVTLAGDTRIADLRHAPARIAEQVYPPNTALRLDVSALQMHPRRQEILKALQDLIDKNAVDARMTGYEQDYDLRIVPPETAIRSGVVKDRIRGDMTAPNSLVIERPEISLLAANTGDEDHPLYREALPDDTDLAQRIKVAIAHEIKWRLVSGLTSPQSQGLFKIEVRILPCEVDAHKMWVRDKTLPATGADNPTLSVGEYFRIEVKNAGQTGAYVSLLDLQSDGQINAVWPQKGQATNNFIPPHTAFPVRLPDNTPMAFVVTGPIGPETIKAIATLKPSDFSLLADNQSIARGAQPRGTLSPLQQLLYAVADGTRGSGAAQVPPGGWGAADFHFTILSGVAN